MRSIKRITDKQKKKLLAVIETSTNKRAVKRAHVIMMSSNGDSIQKISEFYDCDRDSVSSWLTNWEDQSFKGLYDLPRSGRPPLLDKS